MKTTKLTRKVRITWGSRKREWTAVTEIAAMPILKARSLKQIRKRLKEEFARRTQAAYENGELKTFNVQPYDVELLETIVLPKKVQKLLDAVEAADNDRLLKIVRQKAACGLADAGFSRRDAGDLIGVSRQTVSNYVIDAFIERHPERYAV